MTMQPPGEGSAEASARKGGQPRTEFIIFFVWTEPTNSDGLLKLVEPSHAETGGGGGMGGIMGGAGKGGAGMPRGGGGS
jgi:hypothetical protein